MELIKITNKKPFLIDGSGFQYRQHLKNKDGPISWLCENEKKKLQRNVKVTRQECAFHHRSRVHSRCGQRLKSQNPYL